MKIKRARIMLVFGLGFTLTLFGLLHNLPGGTLSVQAASYTVCPAGPPTCDFNTIQAAVDAAKNGDIIKVAAGTYTDVHERPRRDIVVGGVVNQVVYIDKSVTVQGGYTPLNFSAPPNPTVNVTTIDAQQKARGFYVTGAVNATVENFRIINGSADNNLGGGTYPPGMAGSGGGVYVITGTITVINNQIIDNTAYSEGGGLFIYRSNATLIANEIRYNGLGCVSALGCSSGGGFSLYYGKATFINNIISDNSAYLDGGFSIANSDVTLDRNTIANNQKGGGSLYGIVHNALLIGNTITGSRIVSGLRLFGTNAKLIGNAIIENNTTGLFLYESNGELDRNILAKNRGAGLELSKSSPIIDGNIITGNTGGGLDIFSGAPLLINNVIAQNQTGHGSGGISIRDSSAQLLHNTISSNTGRDSTGITIQGDSKVAITNTILVSHTVGISITPGSTATLNGILWFNNGTNLVGAGAITASQAITGDPHFAKGGYHIFSDSLAINHGVNAQVLIDIDSQPRPYQIPDLGADEFWPPDALKQVYLPVVFKEH